MALQRQGSGTWPMGINASSNGDHKVVGILRPSPGHSRMYDGGRSDQNGLRGSNLKNISRLAKVKRASHSWRFLPCSVPCILVVCLLGLVASVFISHAISHALVGEVLLDFIFLFPKALLQGFELKTGLVLILKIVVTMCIFS